MGWDGIVKGDSLTGHENFLKEEPQQEAPFKTQAVQEAGDTHPKPQAAIEPLINHASAYSVAHTRLVFLKIIFPLWMVSHLVAMMSGYMIFSVSVYGTPSAISHIVLAAGAGVFVYGMFMHHAWARWFGIGYSSFIVLNAWANLVINYVRFYKVIVFTDIITELLLMLIFVIISINLYRNKEYFAGKGNVVFEKEVAQAKRVANAMTYATLAFGFAVYFYFVWIRL